MDYFEFKTGDRGARLTDLIEKHLDEKASLFSFKEWAIYVSHRKVHSEKLSVRPRSMIFGVRIKQEFPKLEVAFENRELIVFDKPSGLSTQKTLYQDEINLYDLGKLMFLGQKGMPQGFPYLGLHHRLDRDTSGLVLMTKMRSANKAIADLFSHRKIKKSYLAFCEFGQGNPQQSWVEKNRIRKGRHKRHKFFFEVGDEGQEAVSEFECLKSVDKRWHQLSCRPRTGRTHQLRVQLAHCGWPILGDRIYGDKKSASRLMLHAQALEFPWKGEVLKIESKQEFSPPQTDDHQDQS
ncbi:MAG: RluA family pseudouridine synthase [Pseudomonadota bacterium]